MGKGKIRWEQELQIGFKSCIVRNPLHIPELSYNLMSMSQSVINGNVTSFCYIVIHTFINEYNISQTRSVISSDLYGKTLLRIQDTSYDSIVIWLLANIFVGFFFSSFD